MGTTIDKVWQLAKPVAESLDLDLWDVRFEKEGAGWFLRIIIEKEGGVNITDCEAMSRAIDGPLDEADPISQSYCLEVSSPGIARRLLRDEHFTKKLGEPVVIRMIRPVDGIREFKGIMKAYEDGVITVERADGELIEIKKSDTSFVRLDDDFGMEILEQ